MAEEKAPEIAQTKAAVPPGGKPVLFIALAVVNMLVVAGLGAMIYLNKKKEAGTPKIDHVIEGELEAQEHDKNSPEFIGKLIPLETFRQALQ